MNKLKSIVVGVDFSECSRLALAQAVRMARWNNAKLHALHCVEFLTLNDTAWVSQLPQEKLERDCCVEAREQMRRWLREAGGSPDSEVIADVGSPLDCILRRVRDVQADLLVLGVTGSSIVPGGAGTLAAKCLRKAPCKVMLVDHTQAVPFRKIVACVDFSEESREVVSQAQRVACQDSGTVDYLHVFTGSWGRLPLVPDKWEVDPKRAEQYRKALELRLRHFVGESRAQSRFAIVEAGSHGHGIADYARRHGADLVILGSKGRSNLSYVLLGSTVERLVRDVPCSVLVTRVPVPETMRPAEVSAAEKMAPAYHL